MQVNDEKPALMSSVHEEAPSNISNLNTIINVATKQTPNNTQQQMSISQNNGQQMILMANQQQHIEQLVNASRTHNITDLKQVTSQQHQVEGITSQPQSTIPSAVTISGNNVAEYVLPAGSNLIQQPTSGMVHAPVMNEEQENELNATYDDIRDKDELREQDRFLPIANVARIMKRAIPETGKIAKDAKECVQECVSEFISFITSEASDRCHQEKRKTINGEDILFAMTTLGFDNYVEPLKLYLTKYRESIKGDKVLNVTNEYGQVDMEDSENNIQHTTLQYQVGGNAIHPSMVSSDGTYAYTQAQVTQLQNMQFNGQ